MVNVDDVKTSFLKRRRTVHMHNMDVFHCSVFSHSNAHHECNLRALFILFPVRVPYIVLYLIVCGKLSEVEYVTVQ